MSRTYLSRGVTRPDNSDVPEGWRVSQLGDLVEVVPGGRLGLTKTDDYRSSGTPAFSAAGQDGFVDMIEFERKGVVLSAIGADCGKCFFASGQWTTLANVQVLLPNSQIIAKYLYYRVNKENYWPRSGSAQPFIKPSAIPKCWLLLPPLPEQRRIAEILDAADEAIRQTERVIAKLREVKKGLLHDLLTRGLDADGNLRDPDAHPEQFKDSPLGRIPREWEVKQLGNVSHNKGDYGSGASALDYNPDFPRYVRITDITEDGQLDPASRKSISRVDAEGYYLQRGDLVFARSGATVGKTYLYQDSDGECAHAGYVIKYSLNLDLCDPRFVFYWTQSDFYWSWVKRTLRKGAQPNINAKEYRESNLVYPPLNEQRRIATILDAHDARIRAEEATLDKLRQVKRGLMDDLLTGRVRV